jgi:hypothetical protein
MIIHDVQNRYSRRRRAQVKVPIPPQPLPRAEAIKRKGLKSSIYQAGEHREAGCFKVTSIRHVCLGDALFGYGYSAAVAARN